MFNQQFFNNPSSVTCGGDSARGGGGAEDCALCALIRAENNLPIIDAMGRGDGEGDRPTDEYSPLTMAGYGSYGYGPNQQQLRYRFVIRHLH